MTSTPQPPAPDDAITVSDSESVLALVPHLLGFEPRDALVTLVLDGKRLVATLRTDLPSPATPAAEREEQNGVYALKHAAFLEKIPNADGAVIVVYSPESAGPGAPHGDLLEQVEVVLALQNVAMRGAWHVGTETWRHYRCPRPACCPEEGNLLSVLERTETHLELTVRGSAPKAGLWDGRNTAPWPGRDGVRRGVDAALSGDVPPRTLRSLMLLWDDLLREPSATVGARLRADVSTTAALLAGMHRLQSRNFLLYIAAGAERAERLPKEPGDPGFTPRMQSSLLRKSHRLASGAVELIIGELDIAPDWQTLDRLWRVGYELVAAADATERSSLMTMLAWIEWARGRSSAASRLLEAGRPFLAHDDVAQVLVTLLSRGSLAAWVQNPRRAWRRCGLDAAA
ncbi:DUF4192 family protein [Zhihengliuella sp.]|uniref:DUF4192 family protein n=1 Tax=Zhihengliuella sp. TaxID=1954483 RepID=UPI00281277AF|nr:DUF4192 family protein [Zhihengliuella sp.]